LVFFSDIGNLAQLCRGDEAEWEMGDNGIGFFVALQHCPFFTVVQHGYSPWEITCKKFKEKGSAGEPFWRQYYSGAGRDSVVSMHRPGGPGKAPGLHQDFHFRKNNGFLGKVNSILFWKAFGALSRALAGLR
jgi:hypothetical protein